MAKINSCLPPINSVVLKIRFEIVNCTQAMKETFNWKRSQREPLVNSRILPWQEWGSSQSLMHHNRLMPAFGWLSRASTCLGSSSQGPARDFWHWSLSCQGNSSSSCWSRWLWPKKPWSSGLLVSLEIGVSCPRWCSCLAMQRGSFPYFLWWWGRYLLWWSGVTAQGGAWPTALGHW